MKGFTKSFSFTIAMAVLQFSISCTKHIPVEKNPRTWENERLIYVTVLSGEKYQIKKPKIEGEHMIGRMSANIALPGDKEIKIALKDIKHIEVERTDTTKTVIALALAAIPVVVILLLIIYGAPGAGLQ